MSKYLGQHFLINKDKLREIVEALELKNGDTVIEIGPGHGELTSEIVSKLQSLKVKKFKIIAIEKDEELADSLKKWSLRATEGSAAISGIASALPRNDGKIEIIHGDALKILPKISKTQNLKPNTYKVVGNIPYYITGYLLRILGELESKPSLIVLTIQKEVAERICAGKSKMNLLAASVQFWAKPKIIGYISKKDFQPAPGVDSAIIALSPRTDADWTRIDADKYYKLIKILFKQPRKTILNNLLVVCRDAKDANTHECREKIIKKLRKLDIDPRARPQDLSIEQIEKLSFIMV
ncbi:MAG: 16S rRNA (adenine(1518)-N(6)/adenine(1519)-N(6))-dimethyltransferase RsmA [bacterium]|nr:16S rRNA (adenine(1518)-N(6)/adenine(1519)-N(6))-dimethyltransferase RsmA [bacterium]